MLKRKLSKIALLLIINLFLTTYCFSQTISTVGNDTVVLISPAQLKLTNQIFNEHSLYKQEVELQSLQITRYKEIYKDELLKDSIYESRIINLNKDLSEKSVIINEQQLQINSKKKSLLRWRVFGVSVSLIALLYVCTKS